MLERICNDLPRAVLMNACERHLECSVTVSLVILVQVFDSYLKLNGIITVHVHCQGLKVTTLRTRCPVRWRQFNLFVPPLSDICQ